MSLMLSPLLLREQMEPSLERISLIGVSGKALHGKDTVASLIARELEGLQRVARVGFADALKEECRANGWNGLKDEAGRALLQSVGIKRRLEDPLYWVKQAFDKMTDPETLYVVPDVRFRNEAEAIRTRGGRLWRVERWNPETDRPFDNGLTAEAKAHPSEVDLDGFDFDVYLMNETGNLENLRGQVREVLGLE